MTRPSVTQYWSPIRTRTSSSFVLNGSCSPETGLRTMSSSPMFLVSTWHRGSSTRARFAGAGEASISERGVAQWVVCQRCERSWLIRSPSCEASGGGALGATSTGGGFCHKSIASLKGFLHFMQFRRD
jgi:hypothetical protein